MYKIKIIEIRGEVRDCSIITTDRVLLIGRSKDADIRINDEKVSKHHALLMFPEKNDGEKLIIKDLGSTNGTFLIGKRLESSKKLSRGDTVRIGATSLLFVNITCCRKTEKKRISKAKNGTGKIK